MNGDKLIEISGPVEYDQESFSNLFQEGNLSMESIKSTLQTSGLQSSVRALLNELGVDFFQSFTPTEWHLETTEEVPVVHSALLNRFGKAISAGIMKVEVSDKEWIKILELAGLSSTQESVGAMQKGPGERAEEFETLFAAETAPLYHDFQAFLKAEGIEPCGRGRHGMLHAQCWSLSVHETPEITDALYEKIVARYGDKLWLPKGEARYNDSWEPSEKQPLRLTLSDPI